MGSLLAIIAIVAIVYNLSAAAATALFFRAHYPAYVRSRVSRGKRPSKIHFIITYGSILDPGDWLEARQRPGYGLRALASAAFVFTIFMALLLAF